MLRATAPAAQSVNVNDATGASVAQANFNAFNPETTVDLPPGDYTATFTAAGLCPSVLSFTISADPDANLSATQAGGTVSRPSVCDPSGGVAQLTVQTNAFPVSVSKNGNELVTSATNSPVLVPGLTGGLNGLVVTNANGCTQTVAVTVDPAIQTTIDDTPTNLQCFNDASGSFTLTITRDAATPVTSVRLQGGDNGFDSGEGAPDSGTDTESFVTYSGLAAGTYTFTAVVEGCAVSETFTLTQPETVGLSAAVEQTTLCPGAAGTVNLTLTGREACDEATANTLYEVSTDNGATFGPLAGLTTDLSTCVSALTYALALPPETYEIIVRTAGSGCESPVRFVVPADFVVLDAVAAGNLTTTDQNCSGEALGSISLDLSGNGGTAQTVTLRNLTTGETVATLTQSAGGGTATFTGLGAGDYAVDVTFGDGCTYIFPESGTAITITEPAPLTLDLADTGGPINCNLTDGGQITATAAGGTPPYVYRINGGTFGPDNVLDAGQENTVTVRDANGCERTETLRIDNVAESDLDLNLGVTLATDCADGTVTITITGGTAPFTLTTNRDGAVTDQALTDRELTQSLPYGQYVYTIIDANGCTGIGTYTVDNSAPEIAFGIDESSASVTPVVCFGQSDGSFSFSIVGGVGPFTVVANGLPQPGSGRNRTIADLPAGSLNVRVTDQATNCEVTTVTNIPEPDALGVLFNYGPPTTCAEDATGSVTLTVSGGTGLRWVVSSVFAGGEAFVDGSNTVTATGLLAGDYPAQLVDENNCTFDFTIAIAGPDSIRVAVTDLTQPDCEQNQTGAFALDVTGGSGGYLVSLDGGPFVPQTVFTNLGAGTFSLRIRDGNGCTFLEGPLLVDLSYTNEIDLGADAGAMICFGSNDGQITLLPSGGNPPYTFEDLATGTFFTDPIVSGLAAGNYDYRVLDGNGCSATVSGVMVSEFLPFDVSAATTPASTCGSLLDGRITLSPLTETGELSYQLAGQSTSQTDNVFTGLAAGTYSVTVTDENDCSIVIDDIVVEALPELTATVNVTQPSCADSPLDNVVTVTGVGGQGPYFYQVNGGPADEVNAFGGLPAGDFTVTVTDQRGCQATVGGQIIVPPALELIALDVTFDDCGMSNGTATAVFTGGTGELTVSWPNGGEGTTTTGLAAGSYAVTVTDDNACQAQFPFAILARDAPSATAITSPDFCGQQDGVVTLSISGGVGNYAVSWPAGVVADGPQATDLAAGSYDYVITDVETGCTTAGTATVALVEGPQQLTFINEVPSTCGLDNAAVTAAVTGGTPPYTFSWNHDATLMAATVTDLAPGEYVVMAQDANNCSVEAIYTVAASAMLEINLAELVDANCGQSDGRVRVSTLNATGQVTYSWSADPAVTGDTYDGLPSGAYSVTATDELGCTQTLDFTLDDANGPTVDSVRVTPAICADGTGSVAVFVSGGQPPYTYAWSHDAAVTSNTASNLTAGNYSVTVTDTNGCQNVVARTVGFQGPSTLTLAENTADFCQQANGRLVVSTGGAEIVTYQWSHDADLDTPQASGLAAGTYTLTVTNTFGCQTTETYTVMPQAGVSAVQLLERRHTTCAEDNGVLVVDGMGGREPYAFAWSDSDLNTAERLSLAPGDYTVTVTDADNCFALATYTIEASTLPELIGQNNDPATCGQATGSFTVAIGGGTPPYDLVWSLTEQPVGNTATDLPAGDYLVEVTDAAGCSASLEFTIDDLPPPTLAAAETQADQCGDGTGVITLTPSGGTAPYTFRWDFDPDLTGNVATGLAAGSYAATVTDANGCTASAAATVSLEPAPTVELLDATPSQCGQPSGSLEIGASGSDSFTYGWSHDADLDAPVATQLAAGVYTVTVTGQNGCATVLPLTVLDEGGPETIDLLSTTSSVCGQATGSLLLTVSGGTEPYDYAWDHDATLASNLASDLTGGEYAVTVTDANGCMLTAAFTVEETGGITLSEGDVADATCGEANGSITVSVEGATEPIAYVWSVPVQPNGPTLSGIGAGAYAVTVTDARGCSGTLSVTLDNAGGPSLAVTAADDARCTNDNGSVTVAATGGAPPLTYTWSHDGNLNSPTASGLAAGSYTVSVTDANGCLASVTQSVAFAGPPTASLDVTAPACDDPAGGRIEVTVTGGTAPYTYAWTVAGASGPVLADLPGGSYAVTVTDANGCTTMASTELAAASDFTVVVTNSSSCANAATGTLTASAAGTLGEVTYAWSTGANTQTIGDLAPGSYSVTVTDETGCQNTGTGLVDALASPVVRLVAATSVACDEAVGALTFRLPGTAGEYAFALTPAGGEPTVTPAGDSITVAFTDLGIGVYTLTTTVLATGCQAATPALLNSDAPWSVAVSGLADPSCADAADGQATVTGSDAGLVYTVAWPDGSTATTRSDLGGGSYVVTVTDENDCSNVGSFALTAPDSVMLTVVENNAPTCDGGAGSLLVAAAGGTPPYTYAWSGGLPDGPNPTGVAAGTYSLTVTDGNGCTLVRGIDVDEANGSSLDLGAVAVDTSLCAGDVYVLDLSAFPGRTLSGPAGFSTTDSVAVLDAAGTYTLSVTQGPCTSEAEFTLSFTDFPLEAAFVIASNVVVGDTALAIEIGFPVPETVTWSYDTGAARLVGQTRNEYRFIFDEVGVFPLTMIATGNGCEDIAVNTVTVHADSSTIDTQGPIPVVIREITVAPNPSTGVFQLMVELGSAQPLLLRLYDTNGVAIESRRLPPAVDHLTDYNLDVVAGRYVIQVVTPTESRTVSVLIN